MNDDQKRSEPREAEDEVREWIRLGGRRPAADPERVARVRAKTRAHWREAVQRRTDRRRWVWGLAASVALVSVLGLVWAFRDEVTTAGAGRTAAQVLAVDGPSWMGADTENPRAIAGDDAIRIGTLIWTDAQSRLALVLDETGHAVRMDRSTRVRVVGAETLVLVSGAIYVESGSGRDPIPLRVETPRGVVQDIGTRFEIRLNESAMRVRVRDGAVVVRSDEGTLRVEQATELILPADGSTALRPIPIHGEDWNWIREFAPAPELEGLSARAFLDWAAHEGGWSLVWADERTAELADSTTLGGGVAGLSVEDALSTVLPTCGLEHEISEGVLKVSAERQD